MDNHYHILLDTASGNLSKIMAHINGAYTNYFNTKRERSGHLFQGRYKAILVEADEYAKELSRYIHLNSVRAKIVELPEKYEWSSYSCFIGKMKASGWLNMGFILGYFGKKLKEAQDNYRDFVNALINLDDIGERFGIGGSGVCKIWSKIPDKMEEDRTLREKIKDLEAKLEIFKL